MNWRKRGAKILASFVTGYSSGIAVTVPIFVGFKGNTDLDLLSMLGWPIIAGAVVSLPQLGKVLNEYGNTKDTI